MKRTLVTMLALLMAASGAVSQSRQSGTRYDNLSHLCVRSFEQDSLGNMWIGTLSGLNRYNGYEYEYFHHNPADTNSISSDFVFSLLLDGDNLFIGTANGVDMYNIRTGSLKRMPGPIRPAYQIYKGRGDAIRIASVAGLGTMQLPDGPVTYCETYGSVNKIWEDTYGRLWLGTDGGLIVEGTKEVFPVPGGRKVLCQCTDISGRWYLGTDRGVVCFDEESSSFITPDGLGTGCALSGSQINFIERIGPTKLLIGTAIDGLWQYDILSSVLSGYNGGPFNPQHASEFNCCRLDSQGDVWIGTYDKGFIVAGRQADHFNDISELAAPLEKQFVTRIVEDGAGSLWIACRYCSLFRYSQSGGLQEIDLSDVAPGGGDYLEDFAINADGRFLLAFEKQLVLAEIRGSSARRLATFPLDHVRTIKAGNDDNIYCGGWNGLYVWSGGNSAPHKVDVGQISNIADILVMDDGSLLFSAYGWGVFSLKDGQVEAVDLGVGNADFSSHCITLTRDSGGRLWLGSYSNGLLCKDKETVTRITADDGLQDNSVLSIQEDFSGRIWVSTFHGLSRVDLQAGSPPDVTAFPGWQYHEKSGCRTKSGLLFFGGNHGVTFFNPASFSSDVSRPMIHLEDFKIWGESVRSSSRGSVLRTNIAYTDKVVLNHKNRSFSIDYSGIDYHSSNNLTYRYRLLGFDHGWIDAGAYRRASYSNLRPGSYTFEAVAVSEGGRHSSEPVRLQIEVKVAPWFSAWAIAIYLLIGILLIWTLARYAWNARMEKQRADAEKSEKERERQMSQMKTVFFTNISHELRTPLTLITALLERFRARGGQDVEGERMLDGIGRNSSRMLLLINQLMDFTKIENGVYYLGVRYADIESILANIVDSFSYLAQKKSINLHFTRHTVSQMMWVDEDKMIKILDNLINNALKYTPEGGEIEVRTAPAEDVPLYGVEQGDYLEVSVADTGCGVQPDKLQELFVRYRKIETGDGQRPDYSGNGIGLHHTRNIVETHHGRIRAARRPSGGMVFSFILPLWDDYSQSEKMVRETDVVAPEPVTRRAPADDASRRTVMVVEDNSELRELVSDLLRDDYRVIEAPDGATAWEALLRENPELVVSDVIMPGLSGYELCARIKENTDMCHIMVVLMTAKTTHDEQMEGLENGADAYICKPFHADYLLKTISNLLRTQDALKQFFQSPSVVRPAADVVISQENKAFLDKLTSILEANLANPELNIDMLAREMGHSRTAFYLKIRRLTSIAPNDLVRNYRFKIAAEAIRNTTDALSNIAERTGFGSYSYFSKAFKKHFGISPKEYRQG